MLALHNRLLLRKIPLSVSHDKITSADPTALVLHMHEDEAHSMSRKQKHGVEAMKCPIF